MSRPARRSRRRPWSTKPTCAWSTRRTQSRGTAAGTSSGPRRRPCGESWSRTPAARPASSAAGDWQRGELSESKLVAPAISDDLLALDEALSQLARTDALAAELVKLRYFAGLTSEQAAQALGLSSRTADRTWSYARAWLRKKLKGD